tara:strand:- start:966 stop:1085 length:120 start_codon:yes stop_codon:yes gene_type:complete
MFGEENLSKVYSTRAFILALVTPIEINAKMNLWRPMEVE